MPATDTREPILDTAEAMLARLPIVATHVEYTFDHGGSAGSPLTITKVQQGLHEKLFGNWSEVDIHYPFDAIEYHSRYLIVAQPQWWDTLEPARIDASEHRGQRQRGPGARGVGLLEHEGSLSPARQRQPGS